MRPKLDMSLNLSINEINILVVEGVVSADYWYSNLFHTQAAWPDAVDIEFCTYDPWVTGNNLHFIVYVCKNDANNNKNYIKICLLLPLFVTMIDDLSPQSPFQQLVSCKSSKLTSLGKFMP